MFILLELLSALTLFMCLLSAGQFLPDGNDFDAYGLKIASNSLMIVEAMNGYVIKSSKKKSRKTNILRVRVEVAAEEVFRVTM